MKAIVDTSSFLALIKYYLPFDKNNFLKNIIQEKFEKSEIIVIDKVFQEAKYISGGIILEKLNFITEKSKFIVKTDEILPSVKFFNLLENQFCNKSIVKLKGLTDIEFDLIKNEYVKGADCRMILYALNIKDDDVLIVTEETKTTNDDKFFKKIPENCSHIEIECCNLPKLLKDFLKIDLSEILK